jgi:hypothetical protein
MIDLLSEQFLYMQPEAASQCRPLLGLRQKCCLIVLFMRASIANAAASYTTFLDSYTWNPLTCKAREETSEIDLLSKK